MSSQSGSDDEPMGDAPTNGELRSPPPESVTSVEVEDTVAMEEAEAEDLIVEDTEVEDPLQGAAQSVQDEPQRIRMLPGSTETAASFEFLNEDHTLGNALRYVIMKNPVVEFCGYTIPHPSEAKMNLRIQTFDDAVVYDVLEKGLNDLMDLCDVVLDKFTIARDDFGQTR